MKSLRLFVRYLVATLVSLTSLQNSAYAEVEEIRLAQQYGLAFLPMIVMQHHKLLENHIRQSGLNDAKVVWVKLASGSVMNDALLNGNLAFASGGVPPFITLWAKTKGSLGVQGVAAMATMPLYLNTRNTKVKTVRDFSETDKIALPAVKVSNQAIFLQMAAEQAFGSGQANKLDTLTVSLSHPDAMTALLSGKEINSHFAAPPFQYQELAEPSIHTVFSSYELLGGAHTFALVWTTSEFRKQNPKTYMAFISAFREAMEFIERDPKGAAEAYLKETKSKEPLENIVQYILAPGSSFSMTPERVLQQAEFMYRIGSIKIKPDSWQEMFFPEVHNLPGS